MVKKQESPQFEAALDELEKITRRMAEDKLSLEQSLQQFERGIALSRQCQKLLREAEQKVEILTAGEKTEPLATENDDA